jgi:plasmid stabilization system protein ParE
MNYRVRLTLKAEQDVSDVLAWFREQSAIEAGSKWFARLMAQVDKLETMPERCGLAAESEDLGLEIRELHLGQRRGKYRLLFEIRGQVVYILRVWHSARDAVSRDDL